MVEGKDLIRYGAIAGLVFLAAPADACHRFRYWYYPHPQRCSVKGGEARRPVQVSQQYKSLPRVVSPRREASAAAVVAPPSWPLPPLTAEFDGDAAGDDAIRLRLLGEFR